MKFRSQKVLGPRNLKFEWDHRPHKGVFCTYRYGKTKLRQILSFSPCFVPDKTEIEKIPVL